MVGATILSATVAIVVAFTSAADNDYTQSTDTQKRLSRIEAQNEYIQQQITELKDELRRRPGT